MPRNQLTKKQADFLSYILSFHDRHKQWPTYKQMQKHFGWASPNSVTQNLQALRKKRYLEEKGPGYNLTGKGRRWWRLNKSKGE